MFVPFSEHLQTFEKLNEIMLFTEISRPKIVKSSMAFSKSSQEFKDFDRSYTTENAFRVGGSQGR